MVGKSKQTDNIEDPGPVEDDSPDMGADRGMRSIYSPYEPEMSGLTWLGGTVSVVALGIQVEQWLKGLSFIIGIIPAQVTNYIATDFKRIDYTGIPCDYLPPRSHKKGMRKGSLPVLVYGIN